MAFVHCHGRDRRDSCDWEQDDFWSWNYNPIECFFDYVKMYIRPRWVGMDREYVSKGRIARFLGTVRVIEKPYVPHPKGVLPTLPGQPLPTTIREHQEFSWSILGRRFIYMIRKFRKMQWWTWKSYRKAREAGLAVCPACGNPDLCID